MTPNGKVRVNVGGVTEGIWCQRCNTSSAISFDVLMSDDADRIDAKTVTSCRHCDASPTG